MRCCSSSWQVSRSRLGGATQQLADAVASHALALQAARAQLDGLRSSQTESLSLQRRILGASVGAGNSTANPQAVSDAVREALRDERKASADTVAEASDLPEPSPGNALVLAPSAPQMLSLRRSRIGSLKFGDWLHQSVTSG